MTKCPALYKIRIKRGCLREREREQTYVFSELVVICVLDFVKVVFVQLTNKGSKVGVFEHSRKDRLCEFVHVLGCEGEDED